MARTNQDLTDEDYQDEPAISDYCLADYVREQHLHEIGFGCYAKEVNYEQLDQQ